MSDFERKDDLPAGNDSVVPPGSDSDADGEFEVIVSEDPPAAQKTPVEGADGVSGADDGPQDDDPQDPAQGTDEQAGPKSRSARVRARYRQERDQAIAAAQVMGQQLQQLAAERNMLAQARAQAEAQAVENRYHYLESIRQQMAGAKKQAMDEGRSDIIADIDSRMMQLGPELHQIQQRRAMIHQQRPQMPPQMMPQQPPQMMQRPAPARLHEAAEKWANAQTGWLNADPSRLADARNIAQRLEQQGYQPDEPEYYDKLNTALTAIHTDFRPVNPVRPGGATRSAGSAVAGVTRSSPAVARQNRQVTLTPDEMAFCERNNINPKSYAREKVATSSSGR